LDRLLLLLIVLEAHEVKPRKRLVAGALIVNELTDYISLVNALCDKLLVLLSDLFWHVSEDTLGENFESLLSLLLLTRQSGALLLS
jgi:hypothetical protein